LGLASPLATLRAGTTLALANKESLIVGGRFVTDIASAGEIVPVDSEHSAIAQALRSGSRGEVAQLVITATGGPFRGRHRGELSEVTVGEAMAHPTWSMGQVITINSSTLINKGLEVIEAHHLFGMPFDKIAVIGHPQSCIHSMVDFVDGSTIAQVSPPDMRLAISLGLGWPDRVPGAATRFDWSQPQRGTYSHSTTRPFRRCNWPTKSAGPVAADPRLHAANEVCVRAFLGHQDRSDTPDCPWSCGRLPSSRSLAYGVRTETCVRAVYLRTLIAPRHDFRHGPHRAVTNVPKPIGRGTLGQVAEARQLACRLAPIQPSRRTAEMTGTHP